MHIGNNNLNSNGMFQVLQNNRLNRDHEYTCEYLFFFII